MQPALFMSSGPLGQHLRNLCGPQLGFDHVDLLTRAEVVFAVGDTHVFQNGKRYSLSGYKAALYLPGSFDAFLENPFGLHARSRLERRSAAQLALAFEDAVERRAMLGHWTLLGNKPSTGRLASNRLALVQRAANSNALNRTGGSALALCHLLADVECSDWVLKFASDTHVRSRTGAYIPMRLSEPNDVLSNAGHLPCSIERHIVGSRDYRVFVMGQTTTCISWRREPSLLDARMQTSIDAEVVSNATSMRARKQALGTCERFGLNFAAIDLVNDSNGTLYEVDVNPHGSWAWLGPLVRAEIDRQFAAYTSQQSCT